MGFWCNHSQVVTWIEKKECNITIKALIFGLIITIPSKMHEMYYVFAHAVSHVMLIRKTMSLSQTTPVSNLHGNLTDLTTNKVNI